MVKFALLLISSDGILSSSPSLTEGRVTFPSHRSE